MERRDLYDINRKPTGETIFKGEKIPLNRYIIVVLSFIQNSKGEFLVQKRSKQKDGKFASTGGHAKTGENSIEAIISEIREELGLTVLPSELNLIYSGREDSERVFFDIYYLKKDFDIESLTLQKEEVDFVEWDSIEKINELIANNLFLENHVEEFYRMMDILKINKN